MTTTHNNMFKISLHTIIFSIILWLGSAHNITSLRSSYRMLNSETISSINCTYPIGSNCKCPYTCYEQVEDTNYCVAKKCYTYDENLGTCKKLGTSHVAPLVLQAIPITGVFGAGFGNMGRWDIFSMYMGILFGGCCFILITSVTCALCCNSGSEENISKTGNETTLCWTYCSGCLWAIVILVLYIWGIVQTATPGLILDTNGCPLVFGN